VSVIDPVAVALVAELEALFAAGLDAPLDDAAFDTLARRVFAYQCERNGLYRAFCETRGRMPESVSHWTQIPAVPTEAFKAVALTTFPPEDAVSVFHTSGTTRGGCSGRHFFPTLRLYQASMLPAFAAYVLPDGAQLPMLVAGPPPASAPHSSLTHMFGGVIDAFGAEGSGFFWREGDVDLARLTTALRLHERAERPVCLMGTAFALLHTTDAIERDGTRFALAAGSRLVDTGGFKGRSREVPQAELYNQYARTFGVPAGHIVNEYGMTELSSQYYDRVLRDETGADLPRLKAGPPWLRAVVVDPETLDPVALGVPGLARHVDLANLFSVVAVQTDDLAVLHPGGLELLGRAPGAEPRGCSLAMEQLLGG
jgi:Acyl-protein synthetase, LuxE